MKVNANIHINAISQEIWTAITDIRNCADMISEVVEVTLLNEPSTGVVGLKWQETRKMFGKEATETMWITEAVEYEYYQTRAESNGTIYKSKMAITGTSQTSTLTMSFSDHAESLMAKIMSSTMGFFGKNWMKKILQKDLEDINKFVERT
jgi:carbon monoxide dehydrogenase subunit G